jgi:hypothetical protein
MTLEQLYPEFARSSQLALGRHGDYFLEVLRGAIATFVETQQGTDKVDMVARITLSAFLGERFLFSSQRMEGFCLSLIYREVGL